MSANNVSPTAASIEASLRRLGFVDGAPDHIDPATRVIDGRVARALICPGCGKKNMTYKPFRRGSDYAAIAVCKCGDAEVM